MQTLPAIYPELMRQAAFDEGLSPFRCDDCGGHISKKNESDSPIWHEKPEVECDLCGELRLGSVTVIPSSASLVQQGAAEDAIWFHATYVEDWFEKVSTGQGMEEQREDGDFLYVHVGSEDAARDIANHKYFDGYSSDGLNIMLYQVKLKSAAVVSSLIVDDNETWRDFESVTDEAKAAIGGDAVRYLNRWESPGSISLLMDARQLELVSVQQIHSPMTARFEAAKKALFSKVCA